MSFHIASVIKDIKDARQVKSDITLDTRDVVEIAKMIQRERHFTALRDKFLELEKERG